MARKPHSFPTFHWQPGTGGNPGSLKPNTELTEYEVPYSQPGPDGEYLGMRITKTAFRALLADFAARRQQNPVFDIAYVTFSKTSLFRVLSQENCDLVRFYFAFPEPAHLSLVVEGLDSSGVSIGASAITKATTASELVDDPTDPDLEEKGNGGDDGMAVKLLSTTLNQLAGLGILANDNSPEGKQKLGALLLKAVNNL